MKKSCMATKHSAFIALLLLVPIPSIGAFAGILLFPNKLIGQIIFSLSKVWIFALPVVWYKAVDKGKLSWSPPRNGGFVFGVVSGVLISLMIAGGYCLMGSHLIDKEFFRGKMMEIGLASPSVYIGGAAYWILVNSILEEYVWRWFVVKKCEAVFPARFAIMLSALFFTLHHIVALAGYMEALAVILCAIGVFVGGLVWSYMYTRYRSIWPGYVSHAIVDLCIFLLGAQMLYTS